MTSALFIIAGTVRNIEVSGEGKQKRCVLGIPEDLYRGEKKETQWHHITLWGPLANSAEKYLRNGSVVQVQAKVTYKDGFTNFTAQEVSYLADFGKGRKEAQDLKGE